MVCIRRWIKIEPKIVAIDLNERFYYTLLFTTSFNQSNSMFTLGGSRYIVPAI